MKVSQIMVSGLDVGKSQGFLHLKTIHYQVARL